MTIPEKMAAKTASMPSQNTPVATADGNSLRQEILPARSNHMVNHQKPVNRTRPTTANTTGPRARTQGPTQPPPANSQPSHPASQITARGMSLVTR